MAFTFNWQGIRVNPVSGARNDGAARADAANFGGAARGYENRKLDNEYRKLDNEYAAMVRGRRDMQANIDGIKAEIDRLEARQAEIRAIIGGA